MELPVFIFVCAIVMMWVTSWSNTPQIPQLGEVEQYAREHGWSLSTDNNRVTITGQVGVFTVTVTQHSFQGKERYIAVSPVVPVRFMLVRPAHFRSHENHTLTVRSQMGDLHDEISGIVDDIEADHRHRREAWAPLEQSERFSIETLTSDFMTGEISFSARMGDVMVVGRRDSYGRPLEIWANHGAGLSTVRVRSKGRRARAKTHRTTLGDPIFDAMLDVSGPGTDALATLVRSEAVRPVLMELFMRFPKAQLTHTAVQLRVDADPDTLADPIALVGELAQVLAAAGAQPGGGRVT